ncbi:MAG: glycosyltransferase family 2 protein [Eubacterium sp.]|nr:glycosyltransferase family 2 protein [Eubacterium sp.]
MKRSVAMAAYNGEAYLEEQLDSIRNQSLPVDEVVVTDDNSKDGTWAVLEAYQARYPDFPLRIYRNEKNLGYRKNFKRAVSLCSGDLIFLCDQDDAWLPEKVETMCGILDRDPAILVLASSFSLMDGEGHAFELKRRHGWCNQNLYHRVVEEDALVRVFTEHLLIHNFCQGCAQVMRRQIADRFLETFSAELPHDWSVNLIASEQSGLYFYNHPLFRYRIHANNALGLAPQVPWKERLSVQYRTIDARQCRAVLRELKRLSPAICETNPEVRKEEAFIEKYVDAVVHRRFFRLIMMGANPRYQEIKSRKAWAADVVCSLLPFIK